MKNKILMLIAFLIAVAAFVGCQQKADNNPPAATNGAMDQAAVPRNADTNSSAMPTNPASTNNP